MIDWPLILLGGLLGSSHCIGMCGPFALIVGLHRDSVRGNLLAQLTYSTGRLMTYAMLGAVAGTAGKRLTELTPAIWPVTSFLSIVAGALLLIEGLSAAGLFSTAGVTGRSTTGCLTGPLMATLLRHRALRNTFTAGMFTGLLPCGLLYAFVALAGSTGDFLHGTAVMLTFGSGTVPVMVFAGVGGSLATVALRQRILRIAAWCVIATGVLTLWRGGTSLATALSGHAEPTTCPMCASD